MRYTIDKKARLVLSTASSVIEYGDVVAHQNALLADPDFDPSFAQLADVTAVRRSKLTTEQVRVLAQRDIFGAGSRRAAYASHPLAFGVLRMFAVYREIAGGKEEMCVFYDRQSALDWLTASDLPKVA